MSDGCTEAARDAEEYQREMASERKFQAEKAEMRREHKSTAEIVEHSDLWVMLMATIRYALGRRSYMPGVAIDLVQKYKAALTAQQKAQVKEEIARTIEVANGMGHKIHEEEEWRAFLIAEF